MQSTKDHPYFLLAAKSAMRVESSNSESHKFLFYLIFGSLLLSARESSLLLKTYLLSSSPLENLPVLRSAVFYRTVYNIT